MKDWNPPFKPAPWYAHIFRHLLRRNSRKKLGLMNSKNTYKPEDDPWGWRYAILRIRVGEKDWFSVCEEYPGLGYSEAITPTAESLEDLKTTLEMMLKDVKGAIKYNNIVDNNASFIPKRDKEEDEKP